MLWEVGGGGGGRHPGWLGKGIEEDTGGPKTHLICAVQAGPHGDPGRVLGVPFC